MSHARHSLARLGRPAVVLTAIGLLLLGLTAMASRETASEMEVAAARATTGPADGLVGDEVRRFRFEYEVEIPAELEGRGEVDGPLRIFLPIATDATGQRIVDLEIDSPLAGQLHDDARGNRTWSAELPAKRSEDLSIVVRYEVERAVVRSGDERGDARVARQFLGANERVVVDHPILEPILAEIRASSPAGDPASRARAIYDWVVDNVEYKKVGSGWGNGDTFWACSERYGNCTDFHSLFISLARTEGIPARFEMGFPIPADRPAGTIGGYHCWVELWLPDVGWVPIDASEAYKHPEKRELFFGTHPADRMKFTTGRDLRLGPEHRGRPLNYFIYPYLESGAERVATDVRARFRYRVEGAAGES